MMRRRRCEPEVQYRKELEKHHAYVNCHTIKTNVKKTTGDFGKKTTQGVVTGERILYTQPMTGVEAKNRFNLPQEIPLDAANLLKLINENRNQ